jgi:ABC-type amino acid transport substrate-binding protein
LAPTGKQGPVERLFEASIEVAKMLNKWLSHSAFDMPGCTTAATAFAGGTVDQIKSSKQLTIGYRKALVPFSCIVENQKPVDFSMDLSAQVVEKLKQSLNVPQLSVKYLPVTSANHIPLIQNGAVASVTYIHSEKA